MEDFSTCVRITVLTVSYLIPSVFFVNNMLVRRRSQTLRVVVISVGLLTKNVVIAYLLPNSSLDELIVMEIRFLYAVLFAFVTYFLIYYTYYGSILKLGIIQILTETNYFIFFSTLLLCVNRIEGRSDPGGYGITFLLPDLLMIPAVYGLFWLEIFLLKPWLPKIRTFEPKHRRILWIVVTAYFLAGIASNFMNLVELGLFHTLALLPAIILSVPGCAGAIWLYAGYRRRIEQTNAFVHAQKELMELHYRSVNRQISKMEQEQKKIDAQMHEITAMAGRKEDSSRGEDYEERIQNYLRALKGKFDEIQSGIYCTDYLVDSVLCHMAEECRKKEIKVSFSFQKYDRGVIPENELAEIFFQILDYCVRESIAYHENNENQSQNSSLFLRAAALKKMLLLEFSCQSEKTAGKMRRELKRRIMPLVLTYQGKFEIEDGNEKRFCIMMQRG